MENKLNRRKWLKNSALMAGGMAFLSGNLEKLSAGPIMKNLGLPYEDLTDFTAIAQSPVTLKARLLANENPFGPSPAVKKAIMESIDLSYQYPIAKLDILRGKIAEYEGISAENIIITAGSTPLLLAAAMHFSKGGKNIITGAPSYEDLPTQAQFFDGKWVKVPLTSDYKLDLEAMEAKIDGNTGVVYLVNPNNPTGTVLDTQKLKDFCARVSKKVTVIIDEAYIDYLPNPKAASLISSVIPGQNIIVARTFSKLYGFAGLRCGYFVGNPEIIKTLSHYTSGKFSISAPTVAAAIAGYREEAFLAEAFAKTQESKEYLYSILKKEGYNYIPSSTNFVLFPIKMEGTQFVSEMMKRGIGLRNWKFNQQEWCRISIGRMDEMEAFADAFKQIS
jgi:histidinol-phosphate aminotransferase